MNIKSIVLMFAATALAACGSDSEDALMLSEPLPLTVSAAIGTNTRLGTSSDGSEGFSAGDKIYITGTIGGKVQDNLNGEAYELDADGKWNVVTADNKFYYQTTSEVTFSASYIGDATMPSGGVLTNQAAKDFLFASGATGSVSTGGVVSFTFSHRMAKVAFKFANGKGDVTNATSIQSFTVEGLYTSGSYNTTTGEATPSSTSTTLSNQSAGAWIIVYPKEEGDIKVSFSFNNANYNVTLAKQTLAVGNSYEFTINVNNGTVTVQPTITQWSSGIEKEVSAAWTPVIISDKSKVLKYALAFSNGKFINLLNADEISAISSSSSDAVAALIGNRIESVFNNTSYSKSNVSGIVYFLNGGDGYKLSTDNKLNSSYRNGLIIGKTTTATNWQDKAQSSEKGTESIVFSGITYSNNYYYNYSIVAVEGYNKNNSSAGYNSIADNTTIHGYSDTQLMKVYNNTIPYGKYISKSDNTTATYTTRAVKIVSKLNTSAITNTSGWYVPSYKETELLFKEYNASNAVLRNALNKLSSLSLYDCYWTSTEGTIDHSNSSYYCLTAVNSFIFNFKIYYCSHAYLFNNISGAGTPVLYDKFATTYNSKTIYALNVCAF